MNNFTIKGNMISVIVPVYNVEKYLNHCIESILSQTFKNFELILIDDGSTDRSGNICDNYSLKDNRIKVFHRINSGVSNTRNFGIEHSSGKYITFIDSDDWIENSFFQYAFSECESRNLDMYICGFSRMKNDNFISTSSIINEEIEIIDKSISDNQMKELLMYNYISGPWGKLYKRELIGDVRFDESMCFGEDLKFVYEILERVQRLLADTKSYYFYRMNPNGLTSSLNYNKCISIKKTYLFLFDHCDKYYNAKQSNYKVFLEKRFFLDYNSTINEIVNSKINVLRKYKSLNYILKDTTIKNIIKQSKVFSNIREFVPIWIIFMYYKKKFKIYIRKVFFRIKGR